MGSGKTTLGRRLAKKMNYEFIDMDAMISRTSGMTIPGIFEEHGESLFRKWEHDILEEIVRKSEVVVATGGGAPCHSDNLKLMNTHGLTIYLQLPPEVIRDRLINSKTERPLIRGKNREELLEFIRKLLRERESFYLQSRLRISGVNLTADDLYTSIVIRT
jgi:shikimate kinase